MNQQQNKQPLPQNPEFLGKQYPRDDKDNPEPYLAQEIPHLVDAVNWAIRLKRPILLEGDPGCGKTKLAQAVAYEFSREYLHDTENKKWPYHEWFVKSTDQLKDGLYKYDAVRRLYDAQLANAEPTRCQEIRAKLEDTTHTEYIKEEAIASAYKDSKAGRRAIVLIDEIDKADPDLPNDLLLELDQYKFVIKETGTTIEADKNFAPIIFITSNGTRKLPDAFLRRCLYFYFEFPKPKSLVNILRARFENDFNKEWRDDAITLFRKLRKLIAEENGDFGKNVSVSELIDWFNALIMQDAKKPGSVAKLFNDQKKNPLPLSYILLKGKEFLDLPEQLDEVDLDD